MFGRDRTLAFSRVLGACVLQMLEAARSLFAATVVEDHDDAVSELELSAANELSWTAYRMLPGVVEHLLISHAARRQELIRALVEGELHAAVTFVDLVGSTGWAAGTSPSAHAAALGRFEQSAWEAAIRLGGRLVKLIGDEAMVVADSSDVACRIALELCALATIDPDLPSARGAVGVGPLTARAGDYFGPTVNLVARALDQADPGQVVVTTEVATELDAGTWTLAPRGSVELRGVPHPVDLFVVSLNAQTGRT
jgi:class 3 adenylate cyclase